MVSTSFLGASTAASASPSAFSAASLKSMASYLMGLTIILHKRPSPIADSIPRGEGTVFILQLLPRSRRSTTFPPMFDTYFISSVNDLVLLQIYFIFSVNDLVLLQIYWPQKLKIENHLNIGMLHLSKESQ